MVRTSHFAFCASLVGILPELHSMMPRLAELMLADLRAENSVGSLSQAERARGTLAVLEASSLEGGGFSA